jgi:hypothetical protein
VRLEDIEAAEDVLQDDQSASTTRRPEVGFPSSFRLAWRFRSERA